MATIEVNAGRRAIVQIKAQRNYPPGHRSMKIIRQWASLAGLRCEGLKACPWALVCGRRLSVVVGPNETFKVP